MAESKNDLTENKKKRPNKLTSAGTKKEIEFLGGILIGVGDENKKALVNSLIEEAAFLEVVCFQAEEELEEEGLTTETVNALQKFVKAHPSTQIYGRYSCQYIATIHSLIEYLPSKEKEKADRLAALRDEWLMNNWIFKYHEATRKREITVGVWVRLCFEILTTGLLNGE